mgnify:CR=1 FL=1
MDEVLQRLLEVEGEAKKRVQEAERAAEEKRQEARNEAAELEKRLQRELQEEVDQLIQEKVDEAEHRKRIELANAEREIAQRQTDLRKHAETAIASVAGVVSGRGETE